jgi:tyrosine-protein phosphatase SIW14
MLTTPGFFHRFSRRGFYFAPVLFLTVAAFGQQLSGVPNFHVVNDHLYRGAQPTVEGFQNLAKLGVRTVIDLRHADTDALLEKKRVEDAGMRFVNIPMYGMQRPAEADVARALALFEDKGAGPVFVHCKRGADRTGTVVACYRIMHDHWDNLKALQEAKACGMAWMQRAMQHFVMGYKAPLQSASATLSSGTD